VITIPTKLTQQDAIGRLERFLRASLKTKRFSGEICGSSFRLTCSQPVGNSNFRPQFVGTVEPAATGSEVRGDFQFAPSARGFLISWFVFCGFWTAAASISVLVKPGPPVLRLMPLAGVVMLGIGFLFVKFAKSYYNDDKARLARAISEELDG
jgi:hypothetical protein